jgi:hypothetical protein
MEELSVQGIPRIACIAYSFSNARLGMVDHRQQSLVDTEMGSYIIYTLEHLLQRGVDPNVCGSLPGTRALDLIHPECTEMRDVFRKYGGRTTLEIENWANALALLTTKLPHTLVEYTKHRFL